MEFVAATKLYASDGGNAQREFMKDARVEEVMPSVARDHPRTVEHVLPSQARAQPRAVFLFV